MAVKFGNDIVKEIRERGNIEIPEGYVTGEEFEEWLHKEKIFTKIPPSTDISKEETIESNKEVRDEQK